MPSKLDWTYEDVDAFLAVILRSADNSCNDMQQPHMRPLDPLTMTMLQPKAYLGYFVETKEKSSSDSKPKKGELIVVLYWYCCWC